jgi:hypothetical protein
MTTRTGGDSPSLAVRAAVWIGDAFGRWQRRRAAARDDSFVEAWKAAWNEGCLAQKAGQPQTAVPYAHSPQQDAWLAGWLWAARQADAAHVDNTSNLVQTGRAPRS